MPSDLMDFPLVFFLLSSLIPLKLFFSLCPETVDGECETITHLDDDSVTNDGYYIY